MKSKFYKCDDSDIFIFKLVLYPSSLAPSLSTRLQKKPNRYPFGIVSLPLNQQHIQHTHLARDFARIP